MWFNEKDRGAAWNAGSALSNVKAAPDPSSPAPSEIAQWVVFSLDTARYALPLTSVERIVRAAYVTPMPLAPPIVLGAINIEGRVLPVVNVRHRFRLPERPVDPADQFLIARTAARTVVLAIDTAHGVLEHDAASWVEAASMAPHLTHIRGVIALEDGLVLIHDLEQFLSPDEARALDEAVNQQTLHGG